MKITDLELWKKGLGNNQDPYGAAVYRYAEKWANLMEERLIDGKTIADIADQASHDADDEGITGFMYSAAASILTSVWEHGEELRRWHNLRHQISNEGEKANEEGTILNTAILHIGK